MASSPDVKTPTQVLVFLPMAAAHAIVARLEQQGHPATAIQSIPELVDALRSDISSLVITTRADIDLVRNIKPVPVVNLEVFFHTVMSADEGLSPSKQFDGRAFMERVRLLQEPRRER